MGVVAHQLCWFLALVFQVARDPALRGQSVYNMLFGVIFMTLLMTISSLGLRWLDQHRLVPRLVIWRSGSNGITPSHP